MLNKAILVLQLGKYIEEYNSTHDTPLLHDAGTLLGQPIEARKY